MKQCKTCAKARDLMRGIYMATKGDIQKQQDKLKIKAELLAAKVKKIENEDKVKDLTARLRRMGGR